MWLPRSCIFALLHIDISVLITFEFYPKHNKTDTTGLYCYLVPKYRCDDVEILPTALSTIFKKSRILKKFIISINIQYSSFKVPLNSSLFKAISS